MTPNPTDDEAIRRMTRMTRRGFAIGGAAAATGLGGWWWLNSREAVDGQPWPFRRAHEANEVVGRGLFSEDRLAREFDKSSAGEPRVNGWIGWTEGMPVAADWVLTVQRPDAPVRRIRLAELAGLPRVETTNELKCVEGWSQVVTWGGVRFGDFLRAFDVLPPDGSPLRYLLLTTPDEGYSSALDLPGALHPQTMLCDSMNGAPLTEGHGAPVRLVLPIKYGIKNIKWLAGIRFSATKPTDYWTQRGYDWYAGL